MVAMLDDRLELLDPSLKCGDARPVTFALSVSLSAPVEQEHGDCSPDHTGTDGIARDRQPVVNRPRPIRWMSPNAKAQLRADTKMGKPPNGS